MIALAAPPTDDRTWRKIPLVLAGRWPRSLPPQVITTKALDVAEWLRTVEGAPLIAVDVEGGGRTEDGSTHKTPTAIGLAAPGAKTTLLIGWAATEPGHRMAIVNLLTAAFLFVPVLGHWVARDVALLEAEGVHFDRLEDSGILHAVRWPGQPHSLVSACGTYGQWEWSKGMPRHTQGDVLGALDCFYGVQRDMPKSTVADGIELNPMWRRYRYHVDVTLPEAIRLWRSGREVNYVPSVDPTWKQEVA